MMMGRLVVPSKKGSSTNKETVEVPAVNSQALLFFVAANEKGGECFVVYLQNTREDKMYINFVQTNPPR